MYEVDIERALREDLATYDAWWWLLYKRQKELSSVVPESTLILKNSPMAGVANRSSQNHVRLEKHETEKQTQI